ncbi:MAG TPA: FecR family protein [Vicinamibacterales bacterium]|nr:FecR family protein [Vicinamibacterales bacterium]
MIDNDPTPTGDDERNEVEMTMRLLRLAGQPTVPADERLVRVRTRVHAHWDAGVRRRLARRRAALWTGMLAAAAVLVMIVSRIDDGSAPTPAPAAAAWVAMISGPPGDTRRVESSGRVLPLAVDGALHDGDTIETGAAGRVAMRFADGTSMRLDSSSRGRLAGMRAVDLSSGAVYVDTGGAAGLEIRTPFGIARDIGTQFEVRLVAARVRLRVRTGAVELSDRRRTVTGHAGTEILFSATEAESRPFAPFGPEWQWTAEVAAPIDIEGLPLSTYLERLAREQGWSVQYADSSLARDARGIILHGSVAGLAPADALDVAIGTSGLRYLLENGRLVVTRETSR